MHWITVSEPACFGTAPAPGKREQKFGFFKTDYELSKKHMYQYIKVLI